MTEMLDLLRAPAVRDLPPGHLEQRKQMLLEAIAAADVGAAARRQLRSRLRRIASWLGCLLAVAVVAVGAGTATSFAAHADRDQVVEVAAVVGAGSAMALHAAPIRSAARVDVQQRGGLSGLAVVAAS